jgi:hypothetical protein
MPKPKREETVMKKTLTLAAATAIRAASTLFRETLATRFRHMAAAAAMLAAPLAPIPLALVASLAWVAPAAAVDLTTYVPFQRELNCTGPGVCDASLILPANRSVVLEYVSVICTAQPGGSLESWSVTTIADLGPVTHYLDLPFAASFNVPVVAGGQVVRLYANPGTEIFVQAVPLHGQVRSCQFNLSGEQTPGIT